MTKKHVVSLTGGLATLLLSAAAHAVPIPISSSLQLVARADADWLNLITDTATSSQGASLNPLAVTVSANSVSTNGTATVTTSGRATASFVDASQGSLTFTDLGWSMTNVTHGFADLLMGTDWDYTFTVAEDSQFTLNWNITSAGSRTFGLQGFVFDDIDGEEFLELDTSGVLTREILAGATYTFSLDNFANIVAGGTREGYMTGTFNWSITQRVPEPGSLGLLGLGFAGLGYSRRRFS